MIDSSQIKEQVQKAQELIKKYVNKESIMSLFSKPYIIGLDIGSSSIKMAKFEKKEKKVHLVKTDIREFEHTDNEQDRENLQIAALKELLGSMDLKSSDIITMINCPMTSVKSLITPQMPKDELLGAIKLESKKYFHLTDEDVLYDYEVLDEVMDKGVKKYKLAVAAIPRSTVDKYFSLLQRCGIKPASFVPCSWALIKLAISLNGSDKRTRCYIDMGESHTELIISKDKDVLFSRKLPVAGIDFTKSLMSSLASEGGEVKLSLDEAEKVKRKVGIPSEPTSEKIGKITSSQVLSLLTAPLERLSSEIDRSFSYYRQEGVGEAIDGGIVLYGEASSLNGLSDYLSKKLDVDVTHGAGLDEADLGGKVSAAEDEKKSKWALAIGSVVEAVSKEGINLLPPEVKAETKRKTRFLISAAAVTAAFTAFIVLFLLMRLQLGIVERNLTSARKELAALQPDLKKAERIYLASMVLVNEPYWEDVFKELSNVTPEEINFSNMSYSDGALRIQGYVTSVSGEELLSNFIITLEKGLFRDVRLVETRDLEGNNRSYFELRCKIE